MKYEDFLLQVVMHDFPFPTDAKNLNQIQLVEIHQNHQNNKGQKKSFGIVTSLK